MKYSYENKREWFAEYYGAKEPRTAAQVLGKVLEEEIDKLIRDLREKVEGGK